MEIFSGSGDVVSGCEGVIETEYPMEGCRGLAIKDSKLSLLKTKKAQDRIDNYNLIRKSSSKLCRTPVLESEGFEFEGKLNELFI